MIEAELNEYLLETYRLEYDLFMTYFFPYNAYFFILFPEETKSCNYDIFF